MVGGAYLPGNKTTDDYFRGGKDGVVGGRCSIFTMLSSVTYAGIPPRPTRRTDLHGQELHDRRGRADRDLRGPAVFRQIDVTSAYDTLRNVPAASTVRRRLQLFHFPNGRSMPPLDPPRR